MSDEEFESMSLREQMELVDRQIAEHKVRMERRRKEVDRWEKDAAVRAAEEEDRKTRAAVDKSQDCREVTQDADVLGDAQEAERVIERAVEIVKAVKRRDAERIGEGARDGDELKGLRERIERLERVCLEEEGSFEGWKEGKCCGGS